MTKFQIILIGLFVFFAAAGLISFSIYKGRQNVSLPSITIWGTLPEARMGGYIKSVLEQAKSEYKVSYIEFRPERMYDAYVEALIAHQGPDLLLMSHDEIANYYGKIYSIPFKSFSERTFKNTFIQEGELYLSPFGIDAMPFSIDPMIMYWNRDIFSNAIITNPPHNWEEFQVLVPKLTQRDAARNIIQSGVALGEYRNITHAKDIVSLLMLQAGTPIVVQNPNGSLQSVMAETLGNTTPPARTALTFYTGFADRVKDAYAWNRSLPQSKTMFVGNKLAIYFGYASELAEIRQKNPNLNFDIALMPQRSPRQGVQPVNMTFGTMYGVSVSSQTANLGDALQVLNLMTSHDAQILWTKKTDLPSVRRDALVVDNSNSASSIFATSALWAHAWFDPNGPATETIFANMIEGVTSGRLLIDEAVTEAHGELRNLLRQ
jgi:ABC-type glycerol-3-phosphate transport system substrate-binding protein